MSHAKSVLTWCFRVIRREEREDPALQRFSRLQGSRSEQSAPAVAVFFARTSRLG